MTAVASKEVTTRQVAAVSFGFYTPDEVAKLSVKRITQPILLDATRNPVPNGLYDPAMGPIDKHGRCATCTLSANDCPGHFGHVELPLPVYNPLVFGTLQRLLRQQCFNCFHLRMDREEVKRFEAKLALLCSGHLTDAAALQVSQSSLPNDLAEVVTDVGKGAGMAGAGLLRNNGKLGGALTSLTLEAIQDTIADLFARMPKGRCRNCDAHSPVVKKTGGMRLFKSWGSAKSLLHNRKTGANTKSILARSVGHMETIDNDIKDKLSKEDLKRHAREEKKHLDSKAGVGKSEDESDDNEDEKDDRDVDAVSYEAETVEGLIAEQEAARQAAEGRDDDTSLANKLDLAPKFLSSWEVEEMMQRLWEREWRLLALLFGPGGNMWDATSHSGMRRHGHTHSMPGVSLSMKAGELSVQFTREAERAAKESWRMFFIRMLPVAPNKFRPPSVMGDLMYDHPQNVSLQKVLNACLEMTSIKSTMATAEQLANVVDPQQVRNMELNRLLSQWDQLQDAVAGLIDSTMSRNNDNGQGIRQRLEKKEGLFRMNMMGKRVNFAARSVISPDPYIGTGEIGVPPYFAMRLCFPERVTPWNVEKLREAVMRGPSVLNGAVAVEDGNGRIVNLKLLDEKKREAIAKALLSNTEGSSAGRFGVKGALQANGRNGNKTTAGAGAFIGSNKIVYRHLQDGDLMLTNRQPTLHKPGLMAHRARVLKGEKTIRMHYANCSTFNADFDGDEINLHLPQDHFGRAEGYNIVHADHQFCVPTDGKPIRGLIQDHVVAGVLLTKRDTWLNKAEYTQLVYLACSAWRRKGSAAEGPETIELEPPTIMKPRVLWSGKQVVSTAVRFYTHGKPPLTFSAAGKVPPDYWGKTSGEAELIFHKGYMVSGCVDKNAFGKFGLVHAVQEMYGGPAAGALLSCFSRLFTAYLQWHGFTCGFDDLLLNQTVENKRKSILSRAEAIAIRASADFVGLPAPEEWATQPQQHTAELQKAQKQVQAALSERYRASRSTGAAHDMKGSGVMHPLSSDVVKACLPVGQIKPFPGNCLSLMTISGAKGSLVNFSQISCLLGQQELEGRRVPRMASGSTLPCFAPYDGGARSCGFVADRFLSGLRPQEYYFHCMAGREGLIDTTVKTARSGYLQRCMVKNLETLRVHYDHTVRDNADGSIVQFFYGEDGLDVTQVSYMGQLGFLARNAARFSQAVDRPAAKSAGEAANIANMEKDVKETLQARSKLLAKIAEAKRSGDKDQEKKYKKRLSQQEPLMSKFPPTVLGATSEAFLDKLLEYTSSNPEGMLQLSGKAAKKAAGSDAGNKEISFKPSDLASAEQFIDMMCLKYMRALAAPGEAVGVLAAQSIGEPSTQMTLNTFHMAGRGEANVTLGIPRLREILMTAAKKIKTPVMTLPMRAGMGVQEASILAGRMRRLRLAECLAGISLLEQPVQPSPGEGYMRTYTITLKFFSPAQYPDDLNLKFEDLVEVFKGPFCNELKTAVDKEVRRKSNSVIKSVVGKVDGAALRGDDGEGPANISAAADEDGDGEVGGSNRRTAKRARGRQDDVEDGQDMPDPDGMADDNDAEMDDIEQEGKMRFRALDDEATYAGPDNEDREANAANAGRRGLVVEGANNNNDDNDNNDDENDDDDDNDNEEEQEGGNAETPAAETAAKTETSKKDSKSKAAEKQSGLCQISEDDATDIDYSTHTCRVAVRLPLHAPKLLMLEVVEKVAASVMVRQTQGIDKVYVLPGDRGEVARVQTDGVNFEGVWEHSDLVDVNGITTNDVAAMLRTYGVEAARATILREVKSVFAAYGIGVDGRHLGLIADFMTQQGGYRPCNRIGIESSVSPFLKMSFETAAHFLTDATLRHSTDDLKTPSARLCVGQVVELGTGVMGVVQQINQTTPVAAC